MKLLPINIALSLTLAASTVHADPGTDADHFEATMGFLATAQDHRATGFSNDNSNGPALAQTFARAPYDRALGLGLRYDVRAVISHVRMTAGFDLPFTSFDGTAPSRVDDHDVTARSLWSWGLRFGLGGEYSFGAVTPFIDLQGAVLGVSTTVNVDGRAAEYDALRFAFSTRAGVRIHLRRWFFVTASGEVGIIGPTLWSADVGVGFRIGS